MYPFQLFCKSIQLTNYFYFFLCLDAIIRYFGMFASELLGVCAFFKGNLRSQEVHEVTPFVVVLTVVRDHREG